MRELTQENMLEMLCAPEVADAPEESDFVESDKSDTSDEDFVKSWIAKELN